jgi:hypothetical protein
MFLHPAETARVNMRPESVFKKKVEFLKKVYARAHPKMDDKYWHDLAAGRVNEAYWG